MDIKRAKKEIKDSIEAYLAKDEFGDYMIPQIRQRPILLMGPPGIGKTQVMEQVAKECKVALVAYTITHHTRQSAVGLPFIEKKVYSGKEYSVTEYTMSEIIASIYDKMEETGLKEGILFIDEINCVSETLAPTMLQFLQCKMFGNQKIPEGWIIVAAGNPPEYNKSVRDFDVVTLDRIKKIDVDVNYDVWKEYAYQADIHPAILAYLEIRRDYFYRMETTVDGRVFATARGWEDLSQLLKTYEKLGKKADREVVHQYIQHWKIAKDFANYLELYRKYKKDYGLEKIIETRMDQKAIGFNADIKSKNEYNIGDVLKHALPQDFVKFGLIPEFIGRVPVTVSLDMLDRDALIRILKEPKNALTRQYEKLFELDGVKLEFDKDALLEIAETTLKRKTGARGLRAIMENIMMDTMFTVPSDKTIKECRITKEAVLGLEEPKYTRDGEDRKSFLTSESK